MPEMKMREVEFTISSQVCASQLVFLEHQTLLKENTDLRHSHELLQLLHPSSVALVHSEESQFACVGFVDAQT